MSSIYLLIINTNFLVALASFCLYKVSELIFGFHSPYLGYFVFFSTIFAYNYMRLPFLFQNDNKSIWLHTNKSLIYCILLFSGFSILFLCFFFGIFFFQLLVPAIVVSVLYPLSITINKKKISLRNIPFFKIFLISFTWSYVTLLVPIFYFDITIDYFLISSFIQRLLFIIAISIPFDIRDTQIDKIQTFPNTFGVKASKIFAFSCLFLLDVLVVIDFITNSITLDYFLAVLLTVELSALIIYFSTANRSFNFYGILVDSLPIILYIFIVIISMI
ncbi:MAG: hypothetical protein CMP49_04520 [Flavobacteriales bacterium]|jgi:hypothetical protein|nr:hypothetical protein [Flavobacteriales bacterium]|tara:strand:+ start:2320 stop:3144 length:825 start_codon:yes stop_codon:yes gene_type:complete